MDAKPFPTLRCELALTDAELRVAVRHGTLVRLASGLYVDGPGYRGLDGDQQYLVRVRGLSRRVPDLFVSHQSAAALHRLPLYGNDSVLVHLTRPGRGGARRDAVRQVHAANLPRELCARVEGVPVTTVARTVVDVARSGNEAAAIAVADGALHRGLIESAQIALALDVAKHQPGHARCLRLLRRADGRAESVGETFLRIVLDRPGLPPLDLQMEVRDEGGALVGRADGGYLDCGVLLEFDGKIKYESLLRPGESASDAVVREKQREEALTALGWLVVRVTWAELPPAHLLVNRIRMAIDSRRRLVGLGVIRGSARARDPIVVPL